MNLTVYLTNACNLACSYCAVAVNQGPKSTLDAAGLKAGFDSFFREFSGEKNEVVFTGGEPFARYDLLIKGLDDLRSRRPSPGVIVTTNGTLLDAGRVQELTERGATISLSLDGKPGENDAQRFYPNGKGVSVHKEALDLLKDVDKAAIEIRMTLAPDSVGGLSAGVRDFYEAGFRRIHFAPEFFSKWDEASLGLLECEVQGVGRYRRECAGNGAPFECEPFSSLPGEGAGSRPWWKECDTVVLGDDRNFYACHSSLMDPSGKNPGERVGSAGRGLDMKKRAVAIEEAGRFLDDSGVDCSQHVHCPMLFYHAGRVLGRDPKDLLKTADRVSKVFVASLRGAS